MIHQSKPTWHGVKNNRAKFQSFFWKFFQLLIGAINSDSYFALNNPDSLDNEITEDKYLKLFAALIHWKESNCAIFFNVEIND